MPLYEYRCEECGHRFEVLQRLGESAEGLACPECSHPRVEKQFSTFASTASASASAPASGIAGCGGGSGFS